MAIRIRGKIRTISPYYCSWKPGEGWLDVNITTAARPGSLGYQLSPMFVGPVDIPGVPGVQATNIESAWQYSKVYERVMDGNGVEHRHIDGRITLNPTEEWWAFAKAGWSCPQFSPGHPDFKRYKGILRHPVCRPPKAQEKISPTFVWWNGERLSYLEGRQKVYGKLYTEMIVHTAAFRELKSRYDAGENISLFDFDGTDHVGLGRTFEELMNDPGRPFGHGLLLVMLLEGRRLEDLRYEERNTFAYQRQKGLLKFHTGCMTQPKPIEVVRTPRKNRGA